MDKDERIADLISKFMEAQPEVEHVEITPVLHVTSYHKPNLPLDACVRIYERESELIDYLKKLKIKASIDFRVISSEYQ